MKETKNVFMSELTEVFSKRQQQFVQFAYSYAIKNRSLNHLQHLEVRMRAEQHIGDMRQKELALRISTLEACDPDKLFCDEIQALVQEAISELPPTSREVFILSRMKNLPNKEIALRLDISVKTVEFHITRSLKQLRVQLKDYQFLWSFL